MSRDIVYTHPILEVEEFPVRAHGRLHTFVRVRHPDWVNLVPLTDDGRVVLVEQHRHGIDRVTLEIPGGAVDPGEEPEHAGRRELREETGYGGGQVVPLGWVWVNPAIQTNRTWLYAVTGVRRLGEPDPDPTESITVHTVDAGRIARHIETGEIAHSLAVVGLQRAMLRGLLPR